MKILTQKEIRKLIVLTDGRKRTIVKQDDLLKAIYKAAGKSNKMREAISMFKKLNTEARGK